MHKVEYWWLGEANIFLTHTLTVSTSSLEPLYFQRSQSTGVAEQRGVRMHERRKLVYAPYPEEEDEALRTLEYMEFRCGLMVDNVVNWYMESTSSHLFPLVRAVL